MSIDIDLLLVQLSKSFIDCYDTFRKSNLITIPNLGNHSESDLHSWLQYLLIKSGEQEGLIPIPEIKMRLTNPIVYKEFGITNRKRTKSNFKRVDVGYYDSKKILRGFAEVLTMDEAHGAMSSKELQHNWFTPYDSLPFLVENAKDKPEFLIIVLVLLKNTPGIYWKIGIKDIDEKIKTRNYYQVFREQWLTLKQRIKIPNKMLIITEDGVEQY